VLSVIMSRGCTYTSNGNTLTT